MDVLSAPCSSRLLRATLGLCLVSGWLACGAGGSSEAGGLEGGDREAAGAPSVERNDPAPDPSLEGPPDAGFVVWESNRTGNWRIWYRRLDGTGLRRLTAEEEGRQHCCPHISPDGTRLVYLSRPGGRDEYPEVEVPGELRLLSLGGGERTIVPAARSYGWGDRAAVWRNDRELIYVGGGGRSFLLDLKRSVSRALTTEPRESLGWLVDATLSHATTAAPSFSLYDAENRRVVERSELSGCEPYFSHDGRWGFWIPGAGGPIERMELATRETSSILVKDDPRLGEKRYMYFPMLSRDGRRLAFGASDGDHSHFEADYDIFVVPTDPETLDVVGPPLQVTTDSATDRYPDVFPPRPAPGRAGASAQGREPAGSEDPEASWPTTREGLVFLWRTGGSPNLVHDPDLGAERAYNLEARGRARLDHDRAMVLDGGAFVAPPEAAENLLEAVRRSGELTAEATVTPAEEAPAGLRSILAFASRGEGPNLVLGQQGSHLAALLRTAASPPSGEWPVVRLFEVPPGEPTHVVVTYAEGRLVAYRDGKAVFESGLLGGRLSPHWRPGDLWLGSEVGGGGDWAGTLEGIALYGRALEPATVRQSAASYRRILAKRPEVPRVTIRARLAERSEIPTLRQISPYRRALAVYEHEVLGPAGRELQGRRILVARWVILDGETLPAARFSPGRLERLVLEPFEANPQLEGVFLSDTLEGGAGGPLYYAVEARQSPEP